MRRAQRPRPALVNSSPSYICLRLRNCRLPLL